MVVHNISNVDEVQKAEKDKIALIHFYADWSDECKNINNILEALSEQPEYSDITFKKCAAEDLPEISLKFNVTAVPTILFFEKGRKIDELTGADPAALNEKLRKFVKQDNKRSEPPSIISSELIVACVEGNSQTTEELHEILNNAKIKYKSYDVNTDEALKQKLKAHSGSPFPQLYIKGEFIGDFETVKKYNNSGELSLRAEAAKKNLSSALVSRLLSLINKSKRMVFMKGEKEAPRCKFSRELTEILKETGLPYDTFDILTDEDVRQGLKVLMNWPTFPQVYVDGEFIGGVDIIKSLKEDGELLSALKA